MIEGMEVYPLVKRAGKWWLPYGPVADADELAAVFQSDCNVAFLGPDGGSFSFWVNDEGQDVVRIDYGAWQPLGAITLSDWQQEALDLVRKAIDQM